MPARIQRDIQAAAQGCQRCCAIVNMGATAIGTAINVSADYLDHIVADLREITKFPLIQSENLIDGTQNLDGFVNVSRHHQDLRGQPVQNRPTTCA